MVYSRGQGATEYLVILGAVLLVALVVVSLLGWFPALGGSTKEQQSKAYWSGASPFAINSFKVDNTTMTFSLSNRLSDALTLTSIEIPNGTSTFTYVVASPAQSFNGGEEAVVTVPFTFLVGVNATNPCNGVTSKTGNPFELKIVAFGYTQGSITGIRQQGAQSLVGRCS